MERRGCGLGRRRAWAACRHPRRQGRRHRRHRRAADRAVPGRAQHHRRRRRRRRFGLHNVLNGIPAQPARRPGRPADRHADGVEAFIGFVLDDVQQTWAEQFRRPGREYQNARLAMFSNSVSTQGCGDAPLGRRARSTARPTAASTSTSASSTSSAGASARRATSPRRTSSPTRSATTCRTCSASTTRSREAAQRNPRRRRTSSRCAQELQADCLAGVWGHSAQRARPARARRPRGGPRRRGGRRRRPACSAGGPGRARTPSPTAPRSSACAGSSAGFESGDPQDCDTFAAGDL